MLTIESTMVNKSIPCDKTMWSPRFILESYNNDFTIGSKTMETPKASYLLGNILFEPKQFPPKYGSTML